LGSILGRKKFGAILWQKFLGINSWLGEVDGICVKGFCYTYTARQQEVHMVFGFGILDLGFGSIFGISHSHGGRWSLVF